jgi:transposase InsO family protein
MPWQEQTPMCLREEFVTFAQQEGANIAALCRRYGISRKTGSKWLARAAAGETAFADRSHRPHACPQRTPAAIEAAVLALRAAHPVWGGRKLHHALAREGVVQPVPAPSTITAMLARHGSLADPARPRRDYQRFVADAPNDLWQIDFMGQPDLPTGKVHPLTVLDDHARFVLLLAACAAERAEVVAALLLGLFRRYGLPRRILTDNGPPWGSAGSPGLTALEAEWLRLGIATSHGRPRHPQTQGKVERLHRTIWAEVPGIRELPDLATAQRRFDAWRAVYNQRRPHEALDHAVPASRYRPSPRPCPETPPEIVYGPEDAVRKVQADGAITFAGQDSFISHGLSGQPVAVRRTSAEGLFTVWYCQRQIGAIDRRARH